MNKKKFSIERMHKVAKTKMRHRTYGNGSGSDSDSDWDEDIGDETASICVKLTLKPHQALYHLEGTHHVYTAGDIALRKKSMQHAKRLRSIAQSRALTTQEVFDMKFDMTDVDASVMDGIKHRVVGEEYSPELLVTTYPHAIADASMKEGKMVYFDNVRESTRMVKVKLHNPTDRTEGWIPHGAMIVFSLYYKTFTGDARQGSDSDSGAESESDDEQDDMHSPVYTFAGYCTVPLDAPTETDIECDIFDYSFPSNNASIPYVIQPTRSMGFVKGHLTARICARNYDLHKTMFQPVAEIKPWQVCEETWPTHMEKMNIAVERGITHFYASNPYFQPAYGALRAIQTPSYRTFWNVMPSGGYAMAPQIIESTLDMWENLLKVVLQDFRYAPMAVGTLFAHDDEVVRQRHFIDVVNKQLDGGINNTTLHDEFLCACEIVCNAAQYFAVMLFYENDCVNTDEYGPMVVLYRKIRQHIMITDKYTDIRHTWGGDCDSLAGGVYRFWRELTFFLWQGESDMIKAARCVAKCFVPCLTHPRVSTASIQQQQEFAKKGKQPGEEEEVQNHMFVTLITRAIFYDSLQKTIQDPILSKWVPTVRHVSLDECRNPWKEVDRQTNLREYDYGHGEWERNLCCFAIEGTGKTRCYPLPAHLASHDHDRAHKIRVACVREMELMRKLAQKGFMPSTIGNVAMGSDLPLASFDEFRTSGDLASLFYKTLVGMSTDDLLLSGKGWTDFYFAKYDAPTNVWHWGISFPEFATWHAGSGIEIGLNTVLTEEELQIMRETLQVSEPVPHLEATSFTNEELVSIDRTFATDHAQLVPLNQYNNVTVGPKGYAPAVAVYHINMVNWTRVQARLERFLKTNRLDYRIHLSPICKNPIDKDKDLRVIMLVVFDESVDLVCE